MADRIASVNQYVVSPCGQQALACGKCARAPASTLPPPPLILQLSIDIRLTHKCLNTYILRVQQNPIHPIQAKPAPRTPSRALRGVGSGLPSPPCSFRWQVYLSPYRT